MSTQTEQEAKHTSGEWRVLRDMGGTFWLPIADERGQYICAVSERAVAGEAEANARLIAGASVMHDALHAIHTALKESAGGEYWTARAFLDRCGVYHDDLSDLRVLNRVAEIALERAG